MKGKVTDKETGTLMPNVLVMLIDQNGEYVEAEDGYVGTETNTKGEYTFDLSPGMYLSFEAPGYASVTRGYDELVKSGNVKLFDASGTALDKKEVDAYVKDSRKISSGQWMIGIGIGLLMLLIILIIAKKLGWF